MADATMATPAPVTTAVFPMSPQPVTPTPGRPTPYFGESAETHVAMGTTLATDAPAATTAPSAQPQQNLRPRSLPGHGPAPQPAPQTTPGAPAAHGPESGLSLTIPRPDSASKVTQPARGRPLGTLNPKFGKESSRKPLGVGTPMAGGGGEDYAGIRCCKPWSDLAAKIVFNRWFDRLVTLVIVVNCVFLAAADPLDNDPDSRRNQVFAVSDLVFQVIYSVEMLMKISAMGLFMGPAAYLRQGWNLIDCSLVLLGWLPYLFTNTSGGFNSIRVVRVLRPLRTINSSPGLRVLVNSMLLSVKQLANVLALCAFIFSLFGIIGLQLFGGELDQQCMVGDTIVDGDKLCTMTPTLGGHVCTGNATCAHTGVNPNLGVSSFDNIGVALLLVFQCITTEGWTDLMYWTVQATNVWSRLYFICLIVVGSWFLLNLVVAVIVTALAQINNEEARAAVERAKIARIAAKEKRRAHRQAMRAAAALAQANPLDNVAVPALKEAVLATLQPVRKRGDLPALAVGPASHATHAQRPAPLAIPGTVDDHAVHHHLPHVSSEHAQVDALVNSILDGRAESYSKATPGELLLLEDLKTGYNDHAIVNIVADDPVRQLMMAAMMEDPDTRTQLRTLGVNMPSPVAPRPATPTRTPAKSVATRVPAAPKMATPAKSATKAAAFFLPSANPWMQSDKVLVSESDMHVMSHIQDNPIVEMHKPSALAIFMHNLRETVRALVATKAFQNIMTFVIIVNTVFLAMEHHGMEDSLINFLYYANLCISIIFSIEMVLQLFALGFKGYVRDSSHLFDAIIVILCWLDLAVSAAGGFSALRALRLLRVFKLARSWDSLNRVLKAVASSLPKIGPFGVILGLFVFIYALLGMQFLGGQLGSPPPRSNFDSLLWAIVTVFQMMTGENWNDLMYKSIQGAGWGVVSYFVSLIILGNYVVLNLFLAILIDHFTGADSAITSSDIGSRRIPDEEAAAAVESSDSDDNSHNGDEGKLHEIYKRRKSHQLMASPAGQVAANRVLLFMGHKPGMSKALPLSDSEQKTNAGVRRFRATANVAPQFFQGSPFSADPAARYRSLGCMTGTNRFRVFVGELVMHSWFDSFILVFILASCVVLAMDSREAPPAVSDGLWTCNVILTIVFAVEAVLKVIALGLFAHPGAYLRSGWNVLDAVVTLLSVADLGLGGTLKFVKSMRVLRALRPLRAIRRLRGLRVVINAVMKAFPNTVHVALVALLFFFIFGIMGVNFFGGLMSSCSDPTRLCDPLQASDCPAALACNGTFVNDANMTVPRVWQPPRYAESGGSYSFDNSIVAMVTLFEVATQELWTEVMCRAADITRLGWAPERNSSEYYSIFFVLFIIFGSFFILNLFVSIVVDNFRRMKAAELKQSTFLTAEQEIWVEVKGIMARAPSAPFVAPDAHMWYLRRLTFKLVINPRFDFFIMGCIIVNVIFMGSQYQGQTDDWGFVQDVVNYVAGIIFATEMLLKIFGVGFTQYWSSNWNRFDWLLVMLNVISVAIEQSNSVTLTVDLTLFRMFRVLRLFRLLKSVPQLRIIFTTMTLSVPAMANVGTLFFFLLFVYSVAGMQLYGDLPYGQYLNENANFQSFPVSILLLFRMSTGESWDGVMHDCFVDGDLLGTVVAYLFFCTFVLLGQFMMLNLFVAVILENFEREVLGDADDMVKTKDLERFSDQWAIMTRGRQDGRLPAELVPALVKKIGAPLGVRGSLPFCSGECMRLLSRVHVPISDEGTVEYTALLHALVHVAVTTTRETDITFTRSTVQESGQSIHFWYAATILQQRLQEMRQRRLATAAQTTHKADGDIVDSRQLLDHLLATSQA